jgi:beta-glucosidase
VVRVYVSHAESRVEQAIKELAGFSRIELQPGETGTVTIPLDTNAFRFYDVEKKQWVLEPGRFDVRAGSSSADLPLIKPIELPRNGTVMNL